MEKIKAVIDTNVFISSLIGKTKSNPKEIIDHFKNNRFLLVLSPSILKELEAVLREPKLKLIINKDETSALMSLIRIKGLFVIPSHNLNICRDIHDNKILEAALKANANFIVTGDKDLLVLKSSQSVSIVSPKEFLNQLKK